MIATYVIGLREGLEAALVVSILATFLRRSGASLRPLWIGVGTAVALSIAVGVGLDLLAAALPQAAQEGLETVISVVAVILVTSMIMWMSTNARFLKGELEQSAAAALGRGGTWALAGVAFLAVLKEGFETAVFLLATVQASQDSQLAVLGAVLGLGTAVVLGMGLYRGGIRFDISRFFTVTGVVLVVIAAGLVMGAVRTAHEAGWVTLGQARTVDLTWLVPPGTIRAALVTGVLGIPADPRLVEVLAWVAYLVPVMAIVLWPARRRPRGAARVRFQLAVAGGLAATATGLAFLVPPAAPAATVADAPLVADSSTSTQIGQASLTAQALELSPATLTTGDPLTLDTATSSAEEHAGLSTTRFDWTSTSSDGLPATLTLADLVTLEGGRLTSGIDAQRNPGPFDATWTLSTSTTAWATGTGTLVDATASTRAVVVLTGGGLQQSRTLTVDAAGLAALVPASAAWEVDPTHVAAVTAAQDAAASAARERTLWTRWTPLTLALAALVLLLVVGTREVLHRRPAAAAPAVTPPERSTPRPVEHTTGRTPSRSLTDVE